VVRVQNDDLVAVRRRGIVPVGIQSGRDIVRRAREEIGIGTAGFVTRIMVKSAEKRARESVC
jgi:hypothetical protein